MVMFSFARNQGVPQGVWWTRCWAFRLVGHAAAQAASVSFLSSRPKAVCPPQWSSYKQGLAFMGRFGLRIFSIHGRMMGSWLAVLCAFALLGAGMAPAVAQSAMAQTSPQQAVLEKLVIVTAGGEKTFQVEVMRTMEERARGLMFRRYLPRDRGMLFDFAVEAPVAMWMKDTFIPLDMLFIRKDGKISQIADNTEPHSTRTIPSNEPVYSVLEINGGAASALGIKAGDKVAHPLFTKP